MEKDVFVKIIDAIVEFIRISDGLNDVLKTDVNFGIKQIEEIVEALEIQFDDVENWVYWWLFESGEKKEMTMTIPYTTHHKNIVDVWEVYESDGEYKIELPTAGDLYDFLDWNMANS